MCSRVLDAVQGGRLPQADDAPPLPRLHSLVVEHGGESPLVRDEWNNEQFPGYVAALEDAP